MARESGGIVMDENDDPGTNKSTALEYFIIVLHRNPGTNKSTAPVLHSIVLHNIVLHTTA